MMALVIIKENLLTLKRLELYKIKAAIHNRIAAFILCILLILLHFLLSTILINGVQYRSAYSI